MKENLNTEISKLLKSKVAPKGDISKDFSVALFVVATLYELDFSRPSDLAMANHFFCSVGFNEFSKISTHQINDTLEKLVESGALVRLHSQIYAAKSYIHQFTAKVKVRTQSFNAIPKDVLNEPKNNVNYFYYVEDDEGKEYSLISDLMLLPKDEVLVSNVKFSNKAYVNTITKVRQSVLGRFMPDSTLGTIKADEKELEGFVFTLESKQDLNGARSGDVVICEIKRRINALCCSVKVREIVHDIGNLNNIIVMAVLRNEIPNVWPDNLIRSLNKIPDTVEKDDLYGRVDLRELPLVTIDGEDARDFDDAVYCKKEGKKYRLYVSIADVSYYVRPSSLLDKEAVNRCNSSYFPNYVIPMLPEKLSNGICSLNPNVDRCCMTCEMEISALGKIEKYKFYPAVMRSHARLTYTEAWHMIEKGEALNKEHQAQVQDVKELYNLYKAFIKDRTRRGGISVESQEMHFIFDENLEIQGVEPVVRNDAHKLIEECMIAANVAAACFVAEHGYQTLYRDHAKMPEKKLEMLKGQLIRYGLTIPGGESPTPKDIQKLTSIIENREDGRVINEMILRAMAKAEYSPENIGHFGLALEKYAHFTSPIRRYADLQLHRVIKYILAKECHMDIGKMGQRSYTKAELVALGSKCTQREIASDTAEKEVDAALACIYALNFIGETVKGTITGCSRFGVFVHLDDLCVDGMIYIGNMPYYMYYNDKNQTLSSPFKTYCVGDEISVVVAGVDLEEHKVDLLPEEITAKQKKTLNKKKEKVLDERVKQVSKRKVSDKEEILNRIKDISDTRDAKETDLVERKIRKQS